MAGIETMAAGTDLGELMEAMRLRDRARIIPAIRKLIEMFSGLADKIDFPGLMEFLKGDGMAKAWDTLRVVLSLIGITLPDFPLAGASALDATEAAEMDAMVDEASKGMASANALGFGAIIGIVKMILMIIGGIMKAGDSA